MENALTANSLLELLLDVWREVGRHLDLVESVERIAPLLHRGLPVAHMLVRRIDLKRSCVETLAAGACTTSLKRLPVRTECSADALERLLAVRRRTNVPWSGGGVRISIPRIASARLRRPNRRRTAQPA
jgi:hypothetical protein